jgi:hypothetical protein
VILDGATSEIEDAPRVEEESTRTGRAALREVIERKGLFCALYRDRGRPFFLTPKAGESVDQQRLPQVGRAMKALSLQMIPAYSPQARGRRERRFGTGPGRQPQELRLANRGTLEEAHAFLRERYSAEFNQKFTVPAKERGTAFRKTGRTDRDWTFSVQSERVVARDNTMAFRDQIGQLEKTRWRYRWAGCTVTGQEHLDGRRSVRYGPHVVADGNQGAPADQPKPRRGKDGAAGSWEIPPTARDFPFPTAPTTTVRTQKKERGTAA